jgi:hypothetical protein
MNVIPVIIYGAELAVAAIILFYVVEMLIMPANMKRVCLALLRHVHHMWDRYRRTHRAIPAPSGEKTICPPRLVCGTSFVKSCYRHANSPSGTCSPSHLCTFSNLVRQTNAWCCGQSGRRAGMPLTQLDPISDIDRPANDLCQNSHSGLYNVLV